MTVMDYWYYFIIPNVPSPDSPWWQRHSHCRRSAGLCQCWRLQAQQAAGQTALSLVTTIKHTAYSLSPLHCWLRTWLDRESNSMFPLNLTTSSDCWASWDKALALVPLLYPDAWFFLALLLILVPRVEVEQQGEDLVDTQLTNLWHHSYN